MLTIRHNDDLILRKGSIVIAPRMFELDGYVFYVHLIEPYFGSLWCDIFIYLYTSNNKKVVCYRGTYKFKESKKGSFFTFRNKRIYLCE